MAGRRWPRKGAGGPPCKLTAGQPRELQTVLDAGPAPPAGMRTSAGRWPRPLGLPAADLGWTAPSLVWICYCTGLYSEQVPSWQAAERDEAAIARWRRPRPWRACVSTAKLRFSWPRTLWAVTSGESRSLTARHGWLTWSRQVRAEAAKASKLSVDSLPLRAWPAGLGVFRGTEAARRNRARDDVHVQVILDQVLEFGSVDEHDAVAVRELLAGPAEP